QKFRTDAWGFGLGSTHEKSGGSQPGGRRRMDKMDDTPRSSTGPPKAVRVGASSSNRTHVQRGVGAVAAAELRDFSATAESEHLARLEADQALLLRLSLEGFGGRAWEELSRALVEYGFAVMRPWIAMGVVWVKCRE